MAKPDDKSAVQPLHEKFTSAAVLQLVQEAQTRASGARQEQQQQHDSESELRRTVEAKSVTETERIVGTHLKAIAAAAAACDAAAHVACAAQDVHGAETELEAVIMLRAVAATASVPLLRDVASHALETCAVPMESVQRDVEMNKMAKSGL